MDAPIAISLRSRGLTAFPDTRIAGGATPRNVAAAAKRQANRQLASLFCALLAAATSLPPWAWFSAVLCSLAAVFFVTSKSAALTDGLVTQFGVGIWILTAYMAAAGVARRDRGAVLLGQVKACLVSLDALGSALPDRAAAAAGGKRGQAPLGNSGGGGKDGGGDSGGDGGGVREQLQAASMELIDALHVYLGGPQRPNTEGFSWGLLSTANTPAPGLYKLSLEIGTRLRRVQSSVRALGATVTGAGREQGSEASSGSAAVVVAMLQQVASLHAAVEELSTLKELRTPLLLRATARNNVVLVAPLLTGSALAGLARSAPGSGAFVWSVAVGCMLQLLLASLLAVATHLEDPFASPHPDALSLWEARDGLAYMLYGDAAGGVAGAGSAAPAGGPMGPDEVAEADATRDLREAAAGDSAAAGKQQRAAAQGVPWAGGGDGAAGPARGSPQRQHEGGGAVAVHMPPMPSLGG